MKAWVLDTQHRLNVFDVEGAALSWVPAETLITGGKIIVGSITLMDGTDAIGRFFVDRTVGYGLGEPPDVKIIYLGVGQ